MNPQTETTAPAESASTAKAETKETAQQRAAKREIARREKARANPSALAEYRKGQAEQAESAKKNTGGMHLQPRREFDAKGNPKSNPRTRARSARKSAT